MIKALNYKRLQVNIVLQVIGGKDEWTFLLAKTQSKPIWLNGQAVDLCPGQKPKTAAKSECRLAKAKQNKGLRVSWPSKGKLENYSRLIGGAATDDCLATFKSGADWVWKRADCAMANSFVCVKRSCRQNGVAF